jgi:hypothetical protein
LRASKSAMIWRLPPELCYTAFMNDDQGAKTRAGGPADRDRAERLAQQLRANLAKRKAQARARKAGSEPEKGAKS